MDETDYRNGCPGFDYGEHYYSFAFEPGTESLVCVGCGRYQNG